MENYINEKLDKIMERSFLADLDLKNSINPNRDQWQSLLRLPLEEKVCLASFVKFSADPLRSMGGAGALKEYQDRTKNLGIKEIFGGTVGGSFLGEPVRWGGFTFNLREFPNREALIEYVLGDPKWLKGREKYIEEISSIIIIPN